MSARSIAATPHGLVDVTFLFQPRPPQPIRIRLDEAMYSVKSDIEANWVWHAFRGFALLAAEEGARAPRTFAAIGTGSGLDAIGAASKFPSLERIVVTDVETSVVDTAVENVRANVPPRITVEGLAGDVCFPLIEAGRTVDILYTNLPNIPMQVGDIVDHGTFYVPSDDFVIDPTLNRYLLGLQCRFLLSAKRALNPGGFALLMIGGRFSYEIFDLLGRATGYALEEVLSCFKVQTEAENVAAGYAAAERDDTTFDFYRLEEAEAALRHLPAVTGPRLKEALNPWRISAAQAQRLVAAGGRIGHTLHMLKATPRSGGEAGGTS